MSDAAAEMSQSNRIRRCAAILIGVVCCLLVVNVARVVQLKIHPDPRLQAAAGGRESTAREMALRGEILDRRGRVLAVSLVGHRLFVDPALIYEKGWEKVRKGCKADPDSHATADPFRDAARALSSVLKIKPAVLEKELRDHADSRYLVLSQEVQEWQLDALRTLDIPGVGIEPRQVREYPMDSLAMGLIGKVGFDQSGQAGVELARNKALGAKDGTLTFLRDARRNPLWIERDGYLPAQDGVDTRLSIDSVIQEIAERNLAEAVKEYHAGGGRCVVMDVETGDILAMCDVLTPRKGWKEVTSDPNRAITPALGRNRCVTDPYEPGSTFKPFVWAWATKLGVFRPQSTVPTPAVGPHYTSFGRAIRDLKYYGPVSWKTVLVKSLNAGMAIAAERMKQKDMQECVKAFGFGQLTRVGVPGESAGLVTSPAHWSAYTQTSVCMGHEIGVTPVQMVHAFSAFCRDGSVPTLRLTMPDATAADGSFNFGIPGSQIIPEAIALEAREAMEGVLIEGTGRKAQSTLYRMFGKSGTAQLPKPKGQGKGYYEDRYVASFIAGAPFEHPRLVALCVLDDPDKSKGHFGGSIAGPVVRDVMEESLQYLGVAPDQDPSREKQIHDLARGPDSH